MGAWAQDASVSLHICFLSLLATFGGWASGRFCAEGKMPSPVFCHALPVPGSPGRTFRLQLYPNLDSPNSLPFSKIPHLCCPPATRSHQLSSPDPVVVTVSSPPRSDVQLSLLNCVFDNQHVLWLQHLSTTPCNVLLPTSILIIYFVILGNVNKS